MANRNPYVRSKEKNWSESEIITLKKLYPLTSNEEISKKIDRTIKSIRAKAMILSLKKKYSLLGK